MATFKIHDRADGFRVELIGRFAGACVHDLRTTWQNALHKIMAPQFTIDLTGASGCDLEGRKLLREMHQHGTQFAAGTPDALAFLREISARRGPALVQEVPSAKRETANESKPLARSKAAGG